MGYQDIRFELDAGVAVVTLHRPERLNAYSGTMGEELGEAYRRCDLDDDVRAVVLTGAGRGFCAGADMSGGEDTFESRDQQSFSAAGVDPPAWEVRKPVIAAMNGHAIGIGLTLALQCDIRLVAREAKYAVIQVRRGITQGRRLYRGRRGLEIRGLQRHVAAETAALYIHEGTAVGTKGTGARHRAAPQPQHQPGPRA